MATFTKYRDPRGGRSDVVFGTAELARTLTALEREVLPQATARAMNRTVVTVRKVATKRVRQRLGVKAKVVRSRIAIFRASKDNLRVILRGRGRGLSYMAFRPRQTKRGVSVRLPGEPGGSPRRHVERGAFIARMPNGALGVFERIPGKYMASRKGQTKHSQAIRKLYGPGVAPVLADADIQADMQEVWVRELPPRVARELDYYVGRLAARSGRRRAA
jgi:hypothetical protein